ncbi:formylglycine-generating enzyme required for sulfatase activity [Loktanella ponticola]|uniref:Formylglycine-generating enzyme required for sulfatase activity n=1 Tax=Yoonia ponticola TaxID=1524255 RepID=A0A7W9BP08_9RHOB|nr:SUMF1/EgtB/PvdO family nonheme iron enzyme [Yoonia ponticola]MBB5723900.1 formylglycine-generating enzyme required for sulfatase activity [Yoonia ponticola]
MKIILSIAVAAILLVGGWFGFTTMQRSRAIDTLAAETRANLIYVKGGTFQAGNYEITVRLENGEEEVRLVSANALPAIEATLDDFSLLASEALNSSFDLFLAETGRPAQLRNLEQGLGAPEHPARMSWQEATAYCSWLGEVSDISLRLPTEVEWEYAARSRGEKVAWGTAGGEWIPGETVAGPNTPTEVEEMPNQWPPSPMGFHDMASGAKEWVANDEADTRIAKGGSINSDAVFETIPSRTIVEPTTQSWPGEPERYAKQGYPYHGTFATARCASDQIGQGPGAVDFNAPEVIPAVAPQSVTY